MTSRPRLSPDRVVAEAAALADERGIQALSLAPLAERLGVRVPSLYKHVGGLDDLHRRLALAGLRDLADELGAATVGRSGRDALLACATLINMEFVQFHPTHMVWPISVRGLLVTESVRGDGGVLLNSEEVLDSVPREDHDRPVSAVATETGILRLHGG